LTPGQQHDATMAETLMRRRRTSQTSFDAPLRPRNQRRDLRHLQGWPVAERGGRRRRQYRGRAGILKSARTSSH